LNKELSGPGSSFFLPVARKTSKQEGKWNSQGLFFRVLFLKKDRRRKQENRKRTPAWRQASSVSQIP
jgi:hypothetical protein